MKAFLYIATALALGTSCTRKVSKSIEKSKITEEQHTQTVDTSSTNWKTSSTQTTYYGDTLKGSLFFEKSDTLDTKPVKTVWDSLESNGLKIKVGILPTNSGIKLQLNATAKPIATSNNTINEGNTNSGKTENNHVKAEATTEKTEKKVTTSYAGLIKGLVVFLVLIFGIFFLNKKINLWQRLKNKLIQLIQK